VVVQVLAAASASTASTQASNASTSASTATTAKNAAEAAFDSFDDRYLGSKSSDPSADNDGDSLVTGALYFNSSDNSMKVYNGSDWLDAYASLSGAITVGAVNVDNITIDGTEIDLSSGDLTIDVAGDINLDADGGNVVIKDGGTSILDIANNTSDVELTVSTADKNFKIKGTDGSSAITALDIDMAESGAATFNNKIVIL